LSNLDRVLKHKEDVRYRIVGDEAVVVRQNAAEVIAINDVGARILQLIDANSTVGQLIDVMANEYDVTRDELSRDVEHFVAAMHDAGIVEDA
jgi:hypothetical protein